MYKAIIRFARHSNVYYLPTFDRAVAKINGEYSAVDFKAGEISKSDSADMGAVYTPLCKIEAGSSWCEA